MVKLSYGTVREGRHRKLIMGDGLIAELHSGEARTEAPVAPIAAPTQETDSTTEYDSDLITRLHETLRIQ